jgi:hypothetical protein
MDCSFLVYSFRAQPGVGERRAYIGLLKIDEWDKSGERNPELPLKKPQLGD